MNIEPMSDERLSYLKNHNCLIELLSEVDRLREEVKSLQKRDGIILVDIGEDWKERAEQAEKKSEGWKALAEEMGEVIRLAVKTGRLDGWHDNDDVSVGEELSSALSMTPEQALERRNGK